MPAAIYLRKDLAGLLIEIICFTSVSSSKYCSYIWYANDSCDQYDQYDQYDYNKF